MDITDKIRARINSQSDNFYDYLRVYAIEDALFEIIHKLSCKSEIFLFCGVIRDFFLCKFGFVRDLDFVFKDPIESKFHYYRYFHEYFPSHKINSFKGVKLIRDCGPNVDFWQLSQTWGIKNRGLKPTANSLIDSVFFNFSAIVYDLRNHKFIFNDSFVEFLRTKTIDIVYAENPNIPLCLFNIFYYSKELGLPVSKNVSIWLRKYINVCEDFSEIQKKHLGKIIFTNEEIKKDLHNKAMAVNVFGIDWDKYLSKKRVKESSIKRNMECLDKRTEFESDFGRVVFSSAMRRMHDKTQVIPLTSGDKIHTRLTHSMEVMNTAQSLAFNLCRDSDFILEYGKEKSYELERDISAILKTAAFVHDIGNPPFGHFGETIIKNYFRKYLENHITRDKYKIDYEEFDGNAQGFRILTHLSYIGYLSGLNLTYATLGAYLKYPNDGEVDKSYIGTKKHGIFVTEKSIFEKVVKHCNLRCKDGKVKRHPLSFLVEAADSICYSVMDIEDGYSLHWYDKNDILDFLDRQISGFIEKNIEKIKRNSSSEKYRLLGEYNRYCYKNKDREASGDKPKYSFLKVIYKDPSKVNESELNRAHWIMNFRVQLIQYLVELACSNFKNNIKGIDDGLYSKELIEEDDFFVIQSLQEFTKRYIFPRPEIHKAELTGYSVLNGLLDILIGYISSNDKEFRKRVKTIVSKSALRVSIHEEQEDIKELSGLDSADDYKVITEDDLFKYDLAGLSDNAKLRLVVDFVSGMTDKFAVTLYQQLSGHRL